MDPLTELFNRLDRSEPVSLSETQEVILSLLAYIQQLEARLAQAEQTARQAANLASCLANGIQPD